jgi:hypothetical protein
MPFNSPRAERILQDREKQKAEYAARAAEEQRNREQLATTPQMAQVTTAPMQRLRDQQTFIAEVVAPLRKIAERQEAEAREQRRKWKEEQDQQVLDRHRAQQEEAAKRQKERAAKEQGESVSKLEREINLQHIVETALADASPEEVKQAGDWLKTAGLAASLEPSLWAMALSSIRGKNWNEQQQVNKLNGFWYQDEQGQWKKPPKEGQ